MSLILYIYKYVDDESAVFSLVSVVRRLHEQIIIKDNTELIGESANISLESILLAGHLRTGIMAIHSKVIWNLAVILLKQ